MKPTNASDFTADVKHNFIKSSTSRRCRIKDSSAKFNSSWIKEGHEEGKLQDKGLLTSQVIFMLLGTYSAA